MTLHACYILAEVKINQMHNKYHMPLPWKMLPPEKRETTKLQNPQLGFTACFKCRQEGHWTAECKTSCPAKKTTPGLGGGETTKALQRVWETSLKGVEVVEFTHPQKEARELRPCQMTTKD